MQTSMTRVGAATAALLALSTLMSACGGDDAESEDSGSDSPSVTEGRVFDDSEVHEFLGATKDDRFGGDDDWIVTLPSGDTCNVSNQILHTPAEIDLYASAGDPVATNSEGWMGIVVGSYEGATKSCLDEVNERLADFK